MAKKRLVKSIDGFSRFTVRVDYCLTRNEAEDLLEIYIARYGAPSRLSYSWFVKTLASKVAEYKRGFFYEPENVSDQEALEAKQLAKRAVETYVN